MTPLIVELLSAGLNKYSCKDKLGDLGTVTAHIVSPHNHCRCHWSFFEHFGTYTEMGDTVQKCIK